MGVRVDFGHNTGFVKRIFHEANMLVLRDPAPSAPAYDDDGEDRCH